MEKVHFNPFLGGFFYKIFWDTDDEFELWDVDKAEFVKDINSVPDGAIIVPLTPDWGDGPLETLANALRFYKLKVPIFLKTRFELAKELRSIREEKLLEYDKLIDKYSRLARMGNIEASLYVQELDAYAQALCDMPTVTGFPWDGGGELTPWPKLLKPNENKSNNS